MEINLFPEYENRPDKTLMVTSLLYFEDALIKERFEECRELSQLARRYGAKQSQINRVIARHIRRMKKTNRNGFSKSKRNKRF